MKQKEDNNLKKIRTKAEKDYRNIRSVYCPYFKEDIHFNSKGLEHLIFKSKRKVRERNDSVVRLKNIHLAPMILKLSRTLQERQVGKVFVDIKTNIRKERVMKNCDYYGFIAIIEDNGFNKRLKIIVKQVEDGQKHFWSIIPYWKSNKEIKIHSGNMEED